MYGHLPMFLKSQRFPEAGVCVLVPAFRDTNYLLLGKVPRILRNGQQHLRCHPCDCCLLEHTFTESV